MLTGHVMRPDLAIARRAFRQVRTGAAALGVTFGAVAASSALTYVTSFPTEASRRTLAASLSGDAGFSVLLGQVDAIGTVGGYTAYKCYVFLTTIGAVWAALAATRLLRGEEDAGRWDLVLAGRTDPARATMATLSGMAAAFGVVFVGTTAMTMAAGARPGVDFRPMGSVVFGLSILVAPVVFGAVAALCSQLAQTRRLATALTMGVFGIAFVLRMIGDSSPRSHRLLWASPLGWVELMRPFAANDARPLVVAVVVTAGLCGAVVVLAWRRGVGGGLLSTSAASRLRPFGLRSPLGLATRLNAAVLGGWAVGIATVSFVLGIAPKAATSAVAGSTSASSVLV